MREREKSVNLLRPTEKLTAGKKLFSQSEEESKLTYKSHAVHSQKNSKAARD
jgi:hypothetical protein